MAGAQGQKIELVLVCKFMEDALRQRLNNWLKPRSTAESLLLRTLTQELRHEIPGLNEYPKPQTNDSRLLAASLVELFALRLGQTPPQWTKDIGLLLEPIYLLKAAASWQRLRELCETESPEPLHKRGCYVRWRSLLTYLKLNWGAPYREFQSALETWKP